MMSRMRPEKHCCLLRDGHSDLAVSAYCGTRDVAS